MGSGTEFSSETEILDSGLCLGLDENKNGLFPWQDRQIGTHEGQPCLFTQINLATPQSPMHGSVKYFSQNPVGEHKFHQQHYHPLLSAEETEAQKAMLLK